MPENADGLRLDHLERYYRFQSAIYDATRWLFLFGRTRLIDELATILPSPSHIVEIGCGTGHNLARMAHRFPAARLTGVDLSPQMLRLARKKVAHFGDRMALVNEVQTGTFVSPHDVVLFSYSLSMMNPGWDKVITSALESLQAGGTIAVVDFHDSPVPSFQRHMGRNHVQMNGHLLPYLESRALPLCYNVQKAYCGAWRFFVFLGRKL